MRRLAIAMLVVCLSAAGQTLTRITDTWRVPIGGALFEGTVRIVPSTAIVEGAASYISEQTVSIQNGAIDIYLTPNDAVLPANTYYRAIFTPRGNAPGWTEIWVVPTSTPALKRIDIWRQNVAQINSIARLPLSQLSNVGGSGYVVKSNGTNWFSGQLGLDSILAAAKTGDGNKVLTSVNSLTVGCLSMGADGNVVSNGVSCGTGAGGGGNHAATHAAGGTDPLTLAQSQVTGLTTSLSGKSDVAHNHDAAYQALSAVLTSWSAKTVPSGVPVGTTDSQTLTNKILTLPGISNYTVATLPAAPQSGAVAVVTDASAANPCTVGGGTGQATCRYNGSSWVLLGGNPALRTPSGNTTTVLTASGTLVQGKQLSIDANGNAYSTGFDVGATGGGGTGSQAEWFASIDLPEIQPGRVGEATGTLSPSGATVGTFIGIAWPTTLESDLVPVAAIVTASDTIKVFVINNGDSVVDPAATNYGFSSMGPEVIKQASAPSTCTIGKLWYDTDATAGQNLYGCTATDVWTLMSGSGGGSVAGRYSSAINFGAIADGACAQSTFTATGITSGAALALTLPAALEDGLSGSARVSAADTVAVRLCNFSGAEVNPASATFAVRDMDSLGYLVGSGTINFSPIADGACASSTITVTGAATQDTVSPGWPSGLEDGLDGSMRVSATNTVAVRLCNWSGASVDPASATFRAAITK